MNNKTYYFFAIWFLLSCSQSKNNDHWVIDLEKYNVTKLNEIFKSYDLISLETNEKSHIVEFSKLIALENYLYILDRASATISLFDENGRFINKLDSFGDGPGEYLAISDFNINPFNGNIEVISPDGELLIYSKDFFFLDAIDLDGLSSYSYFDYLNDDIIALNSIDFRNISPIVLFSRSQAKMIGRMDLPFTEFEKNFILFMENIFFRTEKGLFICTRFTNDVYQIKLNEPSLIRKFDFGQYFFTDNSLKEGMSGKYYNEFLKERIGNGFASFKKYTESSDHIVFQFPFKNQTGFAIIDKETQGYKILYRYFSFDHFSYDNNEVFSVITPENINNYHFWEEWNSYERQVLQKAQKEEIPLILKFKIK